MMIANNQDDMLKSLFKPVDGSTFDGFIRKVKRTSVDFWARGKEYTITQRGLIVARSKSPDGKVLFQHQIDGLFRTRSLEHEFAEQMLKKHGISLI